LTSFEDVVREVKDHADIVSVVSRYVSLKKRGKNHVGLCPFHSEKTPSFTVSQEKELFHCFGCEKGGDVFGFIMEMEGVDFSEALKMLAREVGVKLPERPRSGERKSLYDDMYKANRMAMEFYHRILVGSEKGTHALAYLEGRGITRETIKSLVLGYAPEEWDSLITHARQKKVPADLLIRCGLAVRGKNGEYDYFRQRILFPIRDNRGHLAGFAGREFGGVTPKYLNSPDTAIFNKRKILYGYHQARSEIRASGEVLVVEGYTDLISLFQAGVKNVVAPMGTALTDDQAALLSRGARTSILVYDRDEAGLKATFRAGDLFLKHGMGVRVVQLPEGEDPDSFVVKRGIKAFHHAVKDAVDVFDLKIGILDEKGLLETIDGKRISTEHLLKTIRVVKDEVIKDLYLGKASESLGVHRKVLEGRLAELKSFGRIGGRERETVRGKDLQRLEGFVERYLIQLMLMGDDFASRLTERLTPDEFANPLYEKAFRELAGIYESNGTLTPDTVLRQVSEDIQPIVSELFVSMEEVTDPDKILQDCLRKLEARRVKREMREIEQQMIQLEKEDDHLANQYYELKKRLISLQSDSFHAERRGDSTVEINDGNSEYIP
jgi:DNA primase